MKVIYIAGPYRGENAWVVEQNIREAEVLALSVWQMGAAALCPHTNARFFNGAIEDPIVLEGDLELLRRCDAVLFTLDWDKSMGARAEEEYARRHGIPTLYTLTQLRAWLFLAETPLAEILGEDSCGPI